MKFNYYDYNANFLEEVIDDKEITVYIFENLKSKLKAEELYQRPFLAKESLFLTIGEFREKICPSDRVILREEKLTAIFYELLSEKEKIQLKVNDYFDVIDLSSKFYNFFAEVDEYNPQQNLRELQNKLELMDWQEDKLAIFFDLRERYLDYMVKKSFTDEALVFSPDNFTMDYFRGYDKFIFVNKLYFTKKEKIFLALSEKAGKEIELSLQLAPADFCEDELKLRSLTLPTELNTELSLYYVEEELLQLLNIFISYNHDFNLNSSEYPELTILDPNLYNNNYHKILNKDLIEVDKKRSFTETGIFQFLNYLYRIFSSRDREKGKLRLEIGEILAAVYNQFFGKYYHLKEDDLENLQKLVKRDYVYLTEDLLSQNDLSNFEPIFTDIKKIEKLNTLKKFLAFLEKLEIRSLNDRLFNDNIQKFSSALYELSGLVETSIISSWTNYFNSVPQGLFKFVINYLRYKEVNEINEANSKASIKLEELFSAGEFKRENLAIINASDGIIPSTRTNFLLNDRQRTILNLPGIEDYRLKEKYYFMRHILNSRHSIVFSLRKLEDNTSESSFVDELALKYRIPISETEFRSDATADLLSNIFAWTGKKIYSTSARKIPADFSRERLVMDKSDFPEQGMSMSYYRYLSLNDCQYRFYLEYIAFLEEKKLDIKREMSLKVFGSFVHEVFAAVIDKSGPELNLSSKKISELVEEIYADYNLKINSYFAKYYHNILLEKVKKSIQIFLTDFKKRCQGDIEEFFTEWKPKELKENYFYRSELADFYLNGRIDLLARGDISDYIVDFKTGGSSTDQLDLYELILDKASEIQENIGERNLGDSDKTILKTTEKMIYNVMEERLLKSYSKKDKFAADLSKLLSEFGKEKIYERKYKMRCKRCPYYDICKVVVK